MVSVTRILITLAVAGTAICTAQTTAPVAYNAGTTRQEPISAPTVTQPVTPELRGDIYMARKMYREAVEAYGSEKKVTAVIANKIGIAYHQMIEYDRAQRQYEIAIKLDKKYPEPVNNLGTIWYAKKSYRNAIRQYNRALKLNPDSASVYSNLGTALFARKKYEAALEAYEKAVALDPEVFERRSSHGVLMQDRSVEERAKFHYYMAKTYAKSGSIERALQYIRKAIEEGFKERERFREDPEFAKVRERPEFEQLIAMETRVL